jgi:hypothetical protein
VFEDVKRTYGDDDGCMESARASDTARQGPTETITATSFLRQERTRTIYTLGE